MPPLMRRANLWLIVRPNTTGAKVLGGAVTYLPLPQVRYRPISLNKLAMVSTAKKCAFEIEIFTLGRGYDLRFCSAALKNGVFSSLDMGSLERLTFLTESVECIRSPGPVSSEYLERKPRVAAYLKLRKTYPVGHGLSFVDAENR